jgi:hypothetical protein
VTAGDYHVPRRPEMFGAPRRRFDQYSPPVYAAPSRRDLVAAK